MLTLDLARAHVDELQRVANAYQRHASGRGRRRLFVRRTRKH